MSATLGLADSATLEAEMNNSSAHLADDLITCPVFED
jgi:hypothetical protein